MKRTSMMIAIALVCMLALGSLAAAQPRGARENAGERAGPPDRDMGPRPPGPPGRFGGPGHEPGMPPPEVMESLGLTDAQRTKISDLHEAELRRRIRAEADLRIAELDLEDLMTSEPPDAAGIDAAVEKVGALRHAMFKARIATRLAFRSILTSEQRTKLKRAFRMRRPHD